MDTLTTLVDATLAIEKVRIRTQVRQIHLQLKGRVDVETDELLIRIKSLEEYTDSKIAIILKSHPAYDWFSKVKGIGRENIGKVVGLVDIERADTISALWKFAGYAPQDGHAMKRIKGEKLCYNSQLRSMCWRLGGSLMKARGKFYDYYLAQKEGYTQRYQAEGKQIVPATLLPKVNGKKQETNGFISEGHIHNQALRKMIKLFLACLWLEWREAEGLPVTSPYAIDKLGHNSFIDPWEMVDRRARRAEKTKNSERAIVPEKPMGQERATTRK